MNINQHELKKLDGNCAGKYSLQESKEMMLGVQNDLKERLVELERQLNEIGLELEQQQRQLVYCQQE